MNLTQSFRTLILALVLSIGVSYAYATWAPPTQTPPLGNIDVPVNVGAGSQTKQGDLSSNSFMSAAQGFFGSVGIGTASVPASLKLGVAGNAGADKYCDRSGGNCITNTGGGIQFPDSTTQTTAYTGGGSVDWSSITNIPAGFADNVDNEGAAPGSSVYECPFNASSCATGSSCVGQITTSSTCTRYRCAPPGACGSCVGESISCGSIIGRIVVP